MQAKFNSDFTKLNKFVKAIGEDSRVQVGIFQNRSQRKDNSTTNAEVGLSHELGVISRNVPIRSWLMMPLRVSANQIVKEGSLGMIDLLAQGYKDRVLKEFGFACENAILDAFRTGGFGTWEPLKPATIKRKGSTAILMDTGQLRRSVASRVVKP